MAKKKEITKEDLVMATLQLSEQLGWEHVRLSDIADEAGITLAELHGHFADKVDILCAFGRMIDARVLEDLDVDLSASPRERLFDVLMDRYEILNDYRAGLVTILHAFRYEPKHALISMPYLCKSMNWMLEASGIDTNGIKGMLKIAGLMAIYVKVLKVWAEDESPDLAKVMAALDKDLGRAESAANSFGF